MAPELVQIPALGASSAKGGSPLEVTGGPGARVLPSPRLPPPSECPVPPASTSPAWPRQGTSVLGSGPQVMPTPTQLGPSAAPPWVWRVGAVVSTVTNGGSLSDSHDAKLPGLPKPLVPKMPLSSPFLSPGTPQAPPRQKSPLPQGRALCPIAADRSRGRAGLSCSELAAPRPRAVVVGLAPLTPSQLSQASSSPRSSPRGGSRGSPRPLALRDRSGRGRGRKGRARRGRGPPTALLRTRTGTHRPALSAQRCTEIPGLVPGLGGPRGRDRDKDSILGQEWGGPQQPPCPAPG